MVLLNAHGNYPYDLFENEGEVINGNYYTRTQKEKSFSNFTMRHNILKILPDPSTPLSQDANNTLFNNVYYTSSVPVPYCGMMVSEIKNEDGEVIQPSSREVELDIVTQFVQQVFSSSRSSDEPIEPIFTKMRMALRDNANKMYYTEPETIRDEKDNDMKEFLIYINSLIGKKGLYKSYYPLCDTNLDKDYDFYSEDNEDEVVPYHGFHIWIDNNYYDLFQESGYEGILNNVISSIPDENPKKDFAIHMLNNIIRAKMLNEKPNLLLSEISLFLWSLDLNDIIISDSACNVVRDMQGDAIVTNDNFKNTIGKLLPILFPDAEDSQALDYASDNDVPVSTTTQNLMKKRKEEVKKLREDMINKKRGIKEEIKEGGKSTKKTKIKKTIKGKRRNKKENKKTKKKANKKESKQKRKQTKRK